jgi:hypothetical protein
MCGLNNLKRNKMTAVEFAFEDLNKWRIENFGEDALIGIPQEVLDKAKEMELSQLVECWNTAHQAGRFEGKGIAEENWQTFETYWQENFKPE